MLLRRIIFTLVLGGLLVPFVLQVTVFPFFRFGMFAEPAHTYRHDTTQYSITWQAPAHGENAQKEHAVNAQHFGLYDATYQQLVNGHALRNEVPYLLEHLAPLLPDTLLMQAPILRAYATYPSGRQLLYEYKAPGPQPSL